MVRFHCQLSGGRKLSLTALKAVFGPTPATAFAKPGLMVSRLRKVGSSRRLVELPPQLELTAVVQGGLPDIRRTSSITFERLKKRPKPRRRAVLPSPNTSHASPMRGWKPLL